MTTRARLLFNIPDVTRRNASSHAYFPPPRLSKESRAKIITLITIDVHGRDVIQVFNPCSSHVRGSGKHGETLVLEHMLLPLWSVKDFGYFGRTRSSYLRSVVP